MRPPGLLALAGLRALAGLLAGPAAAQTIDVSPPVVVLTVPILPSGYGTALNATTVLRWTGVTGNRESKVTVGTVAPGQAVTLRVTATGAIQGTPAGTVTLRHGGGAADLVLDIPRRAVGQATLRYEASVPAGPTLGALVDAHVVLFTITRQ